MTTVQLAYRSAGNGPWFKRSRMTGPEPKSYLSKLCGGTYAAAAPSTPVFMKSRRFIGSARSLELEAQAKLHNTRRAPGRGRSHVAEGGAADAHIRKCESRRIGKVEELGAHLQSHAFMDREFLRERQIHIMDRVAAKLREIPRRVSRHLVTRIGETRGIEERFPGRGRLVVADATRKSAADHVRPLISVGQARHGHGNRKWLAALQRDES